MTLPREFWPTALAALLAIDWLCSLGEANGDTASERTRASVQAIDRAFGGLPVGQAAFTAALVGTAYWFHGHILKPLRHKP